MVVAILKNMARRDVGWIYIADHYTMSRRRGEKYHLHTLKIRKLNIMYQPREPKEGEPVFKLMGDDPLTPLFAEAYGYMMQGQIAMAKNALSKLNTMIDPLPPGDPKILSCFRFAEKCRERQINQIKNPN